MWKIAKSAKQMVSISSAVALFATWVRERNTWQAHGTA